MLEVVEREREGKEKEGGREREKEVQCVETALTPFVFAVDLSGY